MKTTVLKISFIVFALLVSASFVACNEDNDGPTGGYASIFNGEYTTESTSNILIPTIDGVTVEKVSAKYSCYDTSAILTVYNCLGQDKFQIKNITVDTSTAESNIENFEVEQKIDGNTYNFKGYFYKKGNANVFELIITSM